MREKKAALGISLLLLLLTGAYFLLVPVEEPSMDAVFRKEGTWSLSLVSTEEDLLPELCFEGEALPRDRESGTFYVPVDMNNSQWEMGTFASGEPGVEVYLLDNPLGDDKQSAVKEGRAYRLLAVKAGRRFFRL